MQRVLYFVMNCLSVVNKPIVYGSISLYCGLCQATRNQQVAAYRTIIYEKAFDLRQVAWPRSGNTLLLAQRDIQEYLAGISFLQMHL